HLLKARTVIALSAARKFAIYTFIHHSYFERSAAFISIAKRRQGKIITAHKLEWAVLQSYSSHQCFIPSVKSTQNKGGSRSVITLISVTYIYTKQGSIE